MTAGEVGPILPMWRLLLFIFLVDGASGNPEENKVDKTRVRSSYSSALSFGDTLAAIVHATAPQRIGKRTPPPGAAGGARGGAPGG